MIRWLRAVGGATLGSGSRFRSGRVPLKKLQGELIC